MGDEKIVDPFKGITAVEAIADHERVKKEIALKAEEEKRRAVEDRERKTFENIDFAIRNANEKGERSAIVMQLQKEDSEVRSVPNAIGILFLGGFVIASAFTTCKFASPIWLFGAIPTSLLVGITSLLLCPESWFESPIGLARRVWDHCKDRGFKTELTNHDGACIKISW